MARFHPSGSFRGGSGSVTSIDKMSKLREEAMRPVCAASTVLEAKDWRPMYCSVGLMVGEAVVVAVTKGGLVEL